MINKHIFPIGLRTKYGRLCKKCFNCNDHIVEDNEAKTQTRLRCPECKIVSKWHTTDWVSFECENGKIVKTTINPV